MLGGRQSLQKVKNLWRKGSIFCELLLQLIKSAAVGEFAIPKQVNDLLEAGVLGKIFDVVTGIDQLAVLTVN